MGCASSARPLPTGVPQGIQQNITLMKEGPMENVQVASLGGHGTATRKQRGDVIVLYSVVRPVVDSGCGRSSYTPLPHHLPGPAKDCRGHRPLTA